MRLSLWKKLLFAGLPTLLLLAIAEGLVRVTGAAESCPTYASSKLWACDPLLYFKTRPELVVAGGLNQQGFRGRDFGPKKPATYRILSIGDSCTFGITAVEDGLFAPEPYPQRLERIIAERVGPG